MADGDDLLDGLPKTRPTRRSSRRGTTGAKPAAATKPRTQARAKPAATTAKAKPTATKAKPAATTAKAKPTATKAKPAATTAKAKPAATKAKPAATTAKAGTTPTAKSKPATPPRPRAAEPSVPRHGYAAESGHGTGGGDLVGTAVQAAVEVTQLGVAVGTKAARALLQRLPGR